MNEVTKQRIVRGGICLLLLAILLALIQNHYENYDILRNNRPSFFTAAFIIRVAAVCVGILAFLLCIRTLTKSFTELFKIILIIVLLLVVVVSSALYYLDIIDENQGVCLNEVKLGGIIGEDCYRPG